MINKTFRQTNQILFLAFAVTFQSIAADGPASPPAGENQEINQLKSQLAEQQKQIQELRAAMAEQRKLIEANRPAAVAPTSPQAAPAAVPGVRSFGEVASTTPVLPPVAPAALPPVAPSSSAQSDNVVAPLQIHIGTSTITPVGFMDMTAVSRSTNPGTGIGTNFGSIPYGNVQAGSLTETRLSIQNSRIGIRFDAGLRRHQGSRILGV